MQRTADQPLVVRAGTYLIQPVTTIREGSYRVEVLRDGPVARPVDELTASYANERLAKVIAQTLENALSTPGATVKTARRAVVQHLDGELAFLLDNPSIQATNAAAYLQMVKAMFESPEERAYVEELAADMRAFHTALRGANTESHPAGTSDQDQSTPVTAQPRTMADTLPTGTRRQVRPTMAGAHLTPLSEPQLRAIAAAKACGGTVQRSAVFPLPVVNALVRKGYATPNRIGRRLTSVTLNGRGWREPTAVAR